jgi:hypothetical protein
MILMVGLSRDATSLTNYLHSPATLNVAGKEKINAGASQGGYFMYSLSFPDNQAYPPRRTGSKGSEKLI